MVTIRREIIRLEHALQEVFEPKRVAHLQPGSIVRIRAAAPLLPEPTGRAKLRGSPSAATRAKMRAAQQARWAKKKSG